MLCYEDCIVIISYLAYLDSLYDTAKLFNNKASPIFDSKFLYICGSQYRIPYEFNICFHHVSRIIFVSLTKIIKVSFKYSGFRKFQQSFYLAHDLREC